jgi:hypothetical protein
VAGGVFAALVGAGCQVPCVDDGLLAKQHDESCSQVATTMGASTSATSLPSTTALPSTTSPSTGDVSTSTDVLTATGTTAEGSSGGSTGSLPTCDDDLPNGEETDLDCGGPDCPKCAAGFRCGGDRANCASNACNGLLCIDPVACTLPTGVDLLSSALDVLGEAVEVVGDINGDMIDDIVASAPCVSARTFVIYGSPLLTSGFDLEALESGDGGFVLTGSPKIGRVAPAGDFNEDGIGDFAVADGNSGVAFVVFGRTDPAPVMPLNFSMLAPEGRGIRFSGSNLGRGLAGGLDVDGDGKRDLVIGAPGFGEDRIFVVSSSAALTDVDVADVGGSVAGFQISSSQGGTAGRSVALLPSVNGDARAEVIVGAPNLLGGAGRVFVVFGKAGGATVLLDEETPEFYSFGATGQQEMYLGRSVAAAGDVNGDGLADVIAGSLTNQVYVVFGRAEPGHVDTEALGAAGFVISLTNGGGDEVSVNGGPDINGDGLSDLFVGEPHASQETLWVVFGKATTETVNTGDLEMGVGGFMIRLDEPDADFALDVGIGDPLGIGAATAVIGAPQWGNDDGLISLVPFGLCPPP